MKIYYQLSEEKDVSKCSLYKNGIQLIVLLILCPFLLPPKKLSGIFESQVDPVIGYVYELLTFLP